MNAISATIICVSAAVLCTCLKRKWPEIALVTAIAAGIFLLASFLPQIQNIAEKLESVSNSIGSGFQEIKLMLKACGISLAAEFGVQICKDAGESALAGRIHLCSRIAVLGMAAPVAAEIISRLSLLLSL